MERFPLAPFADPKRHRLISEIIRRHSTNVADIRSIALNGLELNFASDVLELGCGFGFMAKAVAARISSHGKIIGVDACSENGPEFLSAVRSQGRDAEFHCQLVSGELPWPDQCFDLVVASYSLYFFPELIPEIARVLRRQGVFVTITHSERSFARLCEAAGTPLQEAPIFPLIRRFSAENGQDRLARCFADTERIDYPNQLLFERDQLEDLLAYALFKLPLIRPEAESGLSFSAPLREALERRLVEGEPFSIEKDDAVFHARTPRCL
ncbi:MAG: class I SAM-dependent methyltransferase [Myxococcota bacterium]|jgi:ubiquinone/menaquinone biosynthesis C-methylase UbiE|nr:class I SAM-dependent methyltransferase [Myxococcota bacterium]